MAASAPTVSSQNPTATVALISPSHASENSSFAASQMLHSPVAIKRQFLNTTSNATTTSTSTSYEIPSSTTESMVATYGPSHPSNKHIIDLAEIICPAVAFGVGSIAFFPLLYYQPSLAKWFERAANEHGGQQAKDWWRAFNNAKQLEKMQDADYIIRRDLNDWDVYIERRILQNHAKYGTPLNSQQVQAIKEATRGERFSIWSGAVRLIPASGSKTLVDQS